MAIVRGRQFVEDWDERYPRWIKVVRSLDDIDLQGQPNGWALISQFRELGHAVALGPREWLVVKSETHTYYYYALVEGSMDAPRVVEWDEQIALIQLYATEQQHADALNSRLYCNAVYCSLRLRGYGNPAAAVPTPSNGCTAGAE